MEESSGGYTLIKRATMTQCEILIIFNTTKEKCIMQSNHETEEIFPMLQERLGEGTSELNSDKKLSKKPQWRVNRIIFEGGRTACTMKLLR